MSMQKARIVDTTTLQHVVTTFKQFEKKLDKLQNDVNYHGQTLSELRVMVANLSGSTLYEVKEKGVSKTTAMDAFHTDEPKTRRKNAIQPLPSKNPPKAFQDHKYGIKPLKDPVNYRLNKIVSNAKNATGKRVLRQRKGEAPRKATTLRAKKSVGKKQKNPQISYEFQGLV